MSDDGNPELYLRKHPVQARSRALVDAVLEAAAQVLAREGAEHLTMTRVAERAGVSVGSLYQYFPNRAALLFKLQSDEWLETGALLCALLEDPEHEPLARLRRMVRAFAQTERAEAAVRDALQESAPTFADAREARAARDAAHQAIARLLDEVLAARPVQERARASTLVTETLGQVGARLSQPTLSAEEAEAMADELADMLCAYIERVAAR